MSCCTHKKAFIQLIIIITILTASVGTVNLVSYAQEEQPETPDTVETYNVYIPQLAQDYPWESPFGIEATYPLLTSNTLLPRAVNLQVGMVRMGNQISWRALQPTEGGPIAWDLLATFEQELRGLKENGIRPLVIIKDSPYWALDPQKALDANGQLSSCGPVAADKFDDFAFFVQQLVERYKTEEFNVHDWELGNEPDVDPTKVPRDYLFGCWGDIDDEAYYGGAYYGEMLKVVAPAIHQADSRAKVWIGGLLLASPESDNPAANGYPERFFRGILASGAAPDFDIVAYHAYAAYWDFLGNGTSFDSDNAVGGPWDPLGGGTVGKARFLRQIMAEYGVNKPVVLNESGFGCIPDYDACQAPDDRFYESQATHLVRFYVRGMSEKIGGFFWYTLNGPGWRNMGLLDGSQQPRKVYMTYQYLSQKLRYARYQNIVDYGPGIEAYAFRVNSQQVHVLWAMEDQTIDVVIPSGAFFEASDRYGNILYDQFNPPPFFGSDYLIQVGFEPILITYQP